VESFVPQADLLPDTDLVVSHGGSGTLVATLAHGLPSVLLPLGADQPHNAARADALGLARILDPATAGPDEIGLSVGEALQDDAALHRARLVADEIGSLPTAEQMVPLLEELPGSV
jgi:UDP:flavonoid glycosyltransferase YjiC (YdhE family)